MGQSKSSHSVSPNGLIEDPDWYKYEEMPVEEINKIQLGKLIIQYCGNEGTTDNEQTASIRKLLQRAITNLEPQQEQYPGVWRDAELKIFDVYGNGYVVRSGQGSVKFVVQITGKGDAELSKINDGSFLANMKALMGRENAPQLQIKGGQGWMPSLSLPWSSRGRKPKSDQGEDLSPSDKEHESPFESPSLMPSDSNDTDLAADEQDNSLSRHDQGEEQLDHKPCSSSDDSSDTDTEKDVAKWPAPLQTIISFCSNLVQKHTDQ